MPLAAQHADIPRLHSLAPPHSSRSAGAALAPAGSGSPGCGEQMAREGRLCWGGGHTPGGAAREERESIPGTQEERGASRGTREEQESILGCLGGAGGSSLGGAGEHPGVPGISSGGYPGAARGNTRDVPLRGSLTAPSLRPCRRSGGRSEGCAARAPAGTGTRCSECCTW